MTSSLRSARRALAALALAVGLSAVPLAGSVTEVQAQRNEFDISGTVIEIRGSVLIILTDDLTGKAQPISVDVAWLRGLQVQVGDPISLTIRPREADTFLATGARIAPSPTTPGPTFTGAPTLTSGQLSELGEAADFQARGVVRESPYVNRLEFGVREEFTVRQDSIQARVGNVPEDDEALNKQRRDLHNLRKKEDDKDKKERQGQ